VLVEAACCHGRHHHCADTPLLFAPARAVIPAGLVAGLAAACPNLQETVVRLETDMMDQVNDTILARDFCVHTACCQLQRVQGGRADTPGLQVGCFRSACLPARWPAPRVRHSKKTPARG